MRRSIVMTTGLLLGLAGFGWAQPVLGVFLTVFLLSLAGFPGTGGFMGKIFLLQGAADAQLWYLMSILVLTTIA